MAVMSADFNTALMQFAGLHQQFGHLLDAWLLIFARVMAFIHFAPVLGRKDVAANIKLSFAIFLTLILLWVVPHVNHAGPGQLMPSQGTWFTFAFQIALNITVGFIIGFIASCIMNAIQAAGDTMTSQIGLSSAQTLDPSSGHQVMIMGNLFGFLGVLIFTQIGGLYWLINAFERSFSIFPIYSMTLDLPRVFNLDYLLLVTSNVLTIAVQLVAPVIVVTLSMDIILGIVNKAAQRMPVFQLSFALKPTVGAAIFLLTLPILTTSMANYFRDFSRFF